MSKLSTPRVAAMAIGIVTAGALGFYYLPGMISEDATGSRVVNAIYCSCITLTT